MGYGFMTNIFQQLHIGWITMIFGTYHYELSLTMTCNGFGDPQTLYIVPQAGLGIHVSTLLPPS